MKYLPLFAMVIALIGCSPNSDSHSSDYTGASDTSLVAPIKSGEAKNEQSAEEADNESDTHQPIKMVGEWKYGDHINAIHLLIKADGTFTTRDWDALSGRGETRTSEGVWSVSDDTVTLVEETFEGNTNAGGQQQRDMKGTLTGNVLTLNDLTFTREN